MFAGPPADAAAWLNHYIEAGARHLIIRRATDDHHTSLERFTARVRPLLNM